jgi:hypothetical protein
MDTMLTNLIVTWIIGMVIPIMVRYVFFRKPLKKIHAVIIIAINVLIYIAAYTALVGSFKGSTVLIVMSFIGYTLLTKTTNSKRDKKNTFQLNRLNGWQRLWLVLSALWVCYLIYYLSINYKDIYDIYDIYDFLFFAFIAPFLGYIIGWMFSWVIKGFKKTTQRSK